MDVDGNMAALRQYELKIDQADANQEMVHERVADARLAAIEAIEHLKQMVNSESEEFGMSGDWYDLKEALEL